MLLLKDVFRWCLVIFTFSFAIFSILVAGASGVAIGNWIVGVH